MADTFSKPSKVQQKLKWARIYLHIARTERAPQALGNAYKGVAKLSDQFADRAELLRFAEQAWQQNGKICTANCG